MLIVHLGLALLLVDARKATEVAVAGQIDEPPKKLGEAATEFEYTFAPEGSKRLGVADAEQRIALGTNEIGRRS